jgi:hypothetical protein
MTAAGSRFLRSAGDVIQLVLSHERNIPKVNIVLAKINFATIALVGALAASPLAAQQAGPEIANFTLANGLELVVIPDHRARWSRT